jgi:phosphatidylinositol-3-phosphatase
MSERGPSMFKLPVGTMWFMAGTAALAVAVAALLSFLPGTSGTRDTAATIGPVCGRAKRPPATYDHVVWVVMENHAYSQIIGSRRAPYINRLAARCGVATRFFAERHPSLPNYIAMTSGSTQGVTDDDGPDAHQLTAPSIFSQLGPRGWRSLQESMPSACRRSDAGAYAVHHNPAAYYTNLRGACHTNVVPLGARPDLSARFTFVTPNNCHNMHDCSVSTGDAWLERFVPKVLASREYRAGRTAMFLTWDEDDDASGNHIPTLVVAPSVRAGTRSRVRFDHYSMLRTTEEMLGVTPLLGNAASAKSIRSAFHL